MWRGRIISIWVKLFRSDLKLNIITCLYRKELSLSNLRGELGSSGSTILHAINDLDINGLTEKSGKLYKLTSLGYMYAVLLDDITSSITTLTKFHDFWLDHDVSIIPEYLLKRVSLLKEALIVTNDSIELDRVHSTFQEILLASKQVFGVSPIFHSDYITTFQKMLRGGAYVELVLTPEVLNKTLEFADFEEIYEYIRKEKLKLFLVDSLRVALTVTEKSFSLGLFTTDGIYDYTKDLVSNNCEVIEWGKRLFNEFSRTGRRLDVSELR